MQSALRHSANRFNEKASALSWSSYWATRYISALSVLTTSDTTQTVTATITGTGFDNCQFEYSLDGSTGWTVKGTSVNGIYNATGLTANTLYYWRAVLYKGAHYGAYSSVASDYTWTTVYKNIYNAMPTKPYSLLANAQNVFFKTIENGVLAKSDVFYLMPQNTNKESEAYINCKNPGTYDLTATVPPEFQCLRGVKGNASSFLTTGYNPSINGVNYTLNSASVGAGSIDLVAATNGDLISAAGSSYIALGTRVVGDIAYWYLNDATGSTMASTSGVANWIINRTANNHCDLWKNKVKTPGSVLSTSIPNAILTLLRRSSGGFASIETLSYAFAGGSLTDSDISVFNDAIETYKTFALASPRYLKSTLAIHVDSVNGVYQFGWNATQIFYSSNSGSTWTTVAFANANTLGSSVIFANGNVWFASLNHCYKSTDGLATYPEVTVLDKNGNAYSAPNPVNYYQKITKIEIFTIGGVEMAVWGNYGNAEVAGDTPINIYRMFNDCIPKITYTFGVNPSYPTQGDPANPVICRHVHGVTYDTVNAVFYCITGDANNSPWLTGIYNVGADSLTWNAMTNPPSTNLNATSSALFYINGYIYFSTDAAHSTLYRCKVADIQTLAKYETVIADTQTFHTVILLSSGVGLLLGESSNYLTTDFFRTYWNLNDASAVYVKAEIMNNTKLKYETYTATTHYNLSMILDLYNIINNPFY
jgi:hypothetical protein